MKVVRPETNEAILHMMTDEVHPGTTFGEIHDDSDVVSLRYTDEQGDTVTYIHHDPNIYDGSSQSSLGLREHTDDGPKLRQSWQLRTLPNHDMGTGKPTIQITHRQWGKVKGPDGRYPIEKSSTRYSKDPDRTHLALAHLAKMHIEGTA